MIYIKHGNGIVWAVRVHCFPAFFSYQIAHTCIVLASAILVAPAIIFDGDQVTIQRVLSPHPISFVVQKITFFFITTFAMIIVYMYHPRTLFLAIHIYPVQRITLWPYSKILILAKTAKRNKHHQNKNKSHRLVV